MRGPGVEIDWSDCVPGCGRGETLGMLFLVVLLFLMVMMVVMFWRFCGLPIVVVFSYLRWVCHWIATFYIHTLT